MSRKPFEIVDRTGKVRIFPDAQSKFIVNASLAVNSNSPPVNPQIRDMLTRLGVETTVVLGSEKTLEVLETMIKTGDQIYILGHINEGDHGTKIITSHNFDPLIISDISQRNPRFHYVMMVFTGLIVIFFGIMFYPLGINLLSK